MNSRLPHVVIPFTNLGCWVIGSAADPNKVNPKDWDLACPFHLWSAVAPMVPEQATSNNLGGWSFTRGTTLIDVWPDDLNRIIVEIVGPRRGWLWHPKSGLRFQCTTHTLLPGTTTARNEAG